MPILRNRGYYITNSDPNLDNNIKDGVTDGATLCYDETNENFYIFKDSETSGSKWVLQESDTELFDKLFIMFDNSGDGNIQIK